MHGGGVQQGWVSAIVGKVGFLCEDICYCEGSPYKKLTLCLLLPHRAGRRFYYCESTPPFEHPQSGVNKSARERIGRQNLSQKVPSKKGSLGVIFSPRKYRENAHSKSANFEGRHSGGHLLGRPLLFTSDTIRCSRFAGKVHIALISACFFCRRACPKMTTQHWVISSESSTRSHWFGGSQQGGFQKCGFGP